MRTPPELGTLRPVEDLPSEDFVAAVEQRAALKGDVAGRTINWRLRRRLKRLAAGLGGIAIVAAIAGGAYLYREDGGDPWADSVAAVGSTADTVGTWIDQQTAETTSGDADAPSASSDNVVSEADQEVLAYNAGTSLDDTASQSTTESEASGTTDTDTATAAIDDSAAGDADALPEATPEAEVVGDDPVETQVDEIVTVEPDAEPVETLETTAPEITAQDDLEDAVDSSDNADVAATVENLVADELPEDEITTPDIGETDVVAVEPEVQAGDVAPTETADAVEAIAPESETPSSDGDLNDVDASEAGDAAAEQASEDVDVPPLPAENIADIDAALPEETVIDETVSEEPVDVAEVTDPVEPVEQLPVMSAYSHSGIRVELADFGTVEQAQDGWRELKSDLGGVVGDHIPVIEEGSAGAGLIYSVQIGYFDSAFAAANFCTAVMDRKVTCTVIPQ